MLQASIESDSRGDLDNCGCKYDKHSQQNKEEDFDKTTVEQINNGVTFLKSIKVVNSEN